MKSILAGLVLTIWIQSSECYSQTDTAYCLPISKARLLIASAIQLRLADSVLNNRHTRIELLENEKESYHRAFTNLLKIEQEKTQYHKEISRHMESLYLSEREQKEYYIKRERKQRRKKNVLTYIGVGLVILIVAR